MPITLDVNDQPATLEAAIDYIVDCMNDEEKAHIRKKGFGAVHHTAGQYMRNSWNLWGAQKNKPTTLYDHVMGRFGTAWSNCPGDDIAGLIYDGISAKLAGRAFDPQASVDRTRRHYERR